MKNVLNTSLIIHVIPIFFFLTIISFINLSPCGNDFCEPDENKQNCANDCDEKLCQNSNISVSENMCIGVFEWTPLEIDVNGIPREMLWKAPKNVEKWTNGTIIWMHGGGGVASNVCGYVPYVYAPWLNEVMRGKPNGEFGNLAVEQGYAVFGLNSAFNRGKDESGLSIGKRWLCMKQNGGSYDLDFIEKLIDEIIPGLRPVGSREDIFIVGHSNGAYMTVYASTTFNNKVQAFAPVAGGDPFGTKFDMSISSTRECVPGAFIDLETGKGISDYNSCYSTTYNNEKEWPITQRGITFKQFYHEDDGVVHFTCMDKIRSMLVSKGYVDDGKFMLPTEGARDLEKHYWLRDYNQPILDFFFSQHSLPDDNNQQAWIVIVSVAIPVSVVLILVIIFIGVIVTYILKRKSSKKGLQLKDELDEKL